MREKDIEKYFVDGIKKIGGTAFKFVSPGNLGVPDRLICLPGGIIAFAEIKAPGKKSRPSQIRQQKRLTDFGFLVFKDIDSIFAAELVITTCKGLISDAI